MTPEKIAEFAGNVRSRDDVIEAIKSAVAAERQRILVIVGDTKEHVSQRRHWTAEAACERIEELISETQQ